MSSDIPVFCLLFYPQHHNISHISHVFCVYACAHLLTVTFVCVQKILKTSRQAVSPLHLVKAI